ncbi:ubiquitin-protein transferase [Aureococcus anophagefferens]|nr:ubiquitin-protein transferase [Aureococcus anophagefferens]
MAAVDAPPPRAVEDDAGATTLTWAEATMLELERSLSHEGRAALAFEGRSGLASLRSTLKALGAFESLRSRVDRAADALDRGVPLERASSARSSRPSRHGSPVKRMNSAPRLGRGRSSSDAGRRAPLEVPGATPVDDGADPAPATPRPPSAGLEALSRSLSMTPGDAAAGTRRSSPARRDQPEPVPCFASLGGAAVVVAVAAGDAHSLAALSSGGLRAFGADRAGACSGGFSQLSKEEHVVPLPEHRHAFHASAKRDAALDRLADVLSWPSLLAASFVAEDAPRCDDFLDYDDDDDDGTRFDDVRFDARAFERCFAPSTRSARPRGRAARRAGREDAVRRKLALAIMAGATRLASAQRDARSPDAARCCVALAAAAATVVASNADDEGCAPPRSGRSALGSHGAKSPAKADDDPEQSGDDDSPSSSPTSVDAGSKARGATSYLAWEAAQATVELLLAMHESARARVIAAALPRRGRAAETFASQHGDDTDARASLRARLRRPLKFLVVAAARRAALDGSLPSGDGVRLSASSDLALQLRGDASLDLISSAAAPPGVPRSEVLESYRVPEVDALGVVIATPRHDDDDARQPRDQPRPQYGAGPGSLLVDFMRWRDAGAPRAGEVTGATASGKWYLSTFSFLAAPATKRELLAVDARRRQGEAGARATMMAPFVVGASLPYLKELKVVFEGEAGVDEGGPRKEFFQLLVPQPSTPSSACSRGRRRARRRDLLQRRGDWYDTEFELAGLLVGLAVYNSVVLEVRLPRVAYKKLLAASPAANASWLADDDAARYTLDDLAELDDDLARGLRMLLAFEPPEDVRETFCRTLVDADPLAPASDGAVVDLVPGGSEIAVTAENRHAYVEALVD